MRGTWTLLFVLAGCIVGDGGDDEDVDVAEEQSADDGALILEARAPYSPSGEPSASRDFNPNGTHNDQCVRLNKIAKLRYPDGTETTYTVNPFKLIFNDKKRTTDDSSKQKCPDGTAQLDVQEVWKAGTQKLYFFRGGSPYTPAGDMRYGHISKDDIDWAASDAAPVRKAAGYGDECGASTNASTKATYAIVPRSIPPKMTFRKSNYAECAKNPPDGTLENCTNGYTSYGNPGQDQGSETTKVPYTYLLWNFTNVPGGGVVRGLLARDKTFHRCNVRAIRQDAYSPDGKRRIGWVQAVYGKVSEGNDWMYGWIVHSHYCDPAAPECAGVAGKVYHVKGA